MLLHCGIHGQFFADGMSCQSPGELVPPLGLLFEGRGGADFGGVEVEGFVVCADGFGDGLGFCQRHDVEDSASRRGDDV